MRIGIIGGGNMARAIIGGALRAGSYAPADLVVSEPDENSRAACAALGVQAIWDNAAAARGADLLVLAVKPQILAAALASLRDALDPAKTLVVTIAAGQRIAFVESHLPAAARVVRVMPNTPLLVGAGISVICAGRHAAPADLRIVAQLFSAGGRTVVLDETHFDAVTAVSGSGPAYFFFLTELLRDAAIAEGLPRDAAELLARQTFIGAARLLESSAKSAEQLRREVTSPGGTTAAAIESFTAGGLEQLVREAVRAATQRGAELAQQ